MGKTACAMAIAIHIAGLPVIEGRRRRGVYFASLEMSKHQLGVRTICMLAGVNSRRVRAGMLTPADWQALSAAATEWASLPIWLDDKPSMSPLEIRSRVKQRRSAWDHEGGPELALVVVDYLQLCSHGGALRPNADRQEIVSYVSEQLKNLAKDMNVPVLALAQLNRAVEKARDKRPELSDLRESGALEQNADTIVFLHREDYYLRDKTPPEMRGVVELLMRKGRNCGTGEARTRFYADCARFADDPAAEPYT